MYIWLDPGHGGRDPGAIWDNHFYEKNWTLEFCLKLQKRLSVPGRSILLTRLEDRSVNLAERALPCLRSDFVLSIHLNTSPDEKDDGTLLFTHENDAVGNMVAGAIAKTLFSKSRQTKLLFVSQTDWTHRAFNVIKFYKHHVPCILAECGYLTNKEDLDFVLSEEGQNCLLDAFETGIVRLEEISNVSNKHE
jgi:N-acetylmuramoyl-L-alanine amidase